jgi:apolipoprotein N-acyltransferase
MMRILLVLLGSIFYALGLPPFDWSVCGWFALVPLLVVIRDQPTGSAFRYGVLFGYASGWTITWCLAEAMAKYLEIPLPLAVVAISLSFLLAIGVPFGLFAAASAVILRSYASRHARFLVPALWVANELLRARVVDQPWALLGYTQHANLGLIQIAACAGVYGVSFLVAFGSLALAEAVWHLRAGHGGWTVLRAVVTSAAVVAGCWGLGTAATIWTAGGNAPKTDVAIVQTNVAPAAHWTRSYTQSQVRAHVDATNSLPATARPALVVWPENAVPRYLETEPMLAVQLARVAVDHRAELLFGAPRYEAGHSYNSARLIRANGRNGGYYDKHHLVMFAEEKPLVRETTTLNESPQEFTVGTGSGVLQSFVPLGVSICHEITYPELIAGSVRAGAELLVNIANDGWMDGGHEFAGRQHLAMAAFRAVENRRYVVRAATTGNSAVIDPYGRVISVLPSGRAGVLTAAVSRQLTLTPYARFGDLFAALCACLGGCAVLREWARPIGWRQVLVRVPLPS